MPRRWHSVRGQTEHRNVVHVVEDQFNFDFTCPQVFDSPSPAHKPKANMFNNYTFRQKKAKAESRPHTSDGPQYAVDKRLHLTKVEDNWIGVAFGSPTHPPTSIPNLPIDESPTPARNASRSENLSLANNSALTKYKKLGSFFKSRSNQALISGPRNVYRIDGGQKMGMPIARKPCPNQHLLPEWLNSETPEAFTPNMFSADAHLYNDNSLLSNQPQRTSLPQLEIQIPSVKMDRYSVMFGDVSGIKRSSLLERRSRNLNVQKKEEQSPVENPMPTLVRPSPPRPPVTPNHHRRKSSTYSLFPSPPKSRGKTSESLERTAPRRQLSYSSRPSTSSERPSTAPEQLIEVGQEPAQDAVEVYKTPRRMQSESSFSTPDGNVTSSDKTESPWRSDESLHSMASSHTSVGSEIYFDIKPARDANGREQSQYIIQKPDYPAIERAVSNSRARKARKKTEEKRAMFEVGPDLQAAEHSLSVEKWRLSMELNQAIAEVEKLTSPLESLLTPTKTPKIAPPIPGPPPRELLPAVKLRKRLDGLAIGIPSPITERPEDISPRLIPIPPRSAKRNTRQHISTLSIKPAPLNVSNESSPVDGSQLTPPPVPLKDAKFLPISRYAANSPSLKVVQHNTRRRKAQRSATEGSVLPTLSSLAYKPDEDQYRPATTANTPDSICQILLSPQKPQDKESCVPTVAVQPMVEVSVAQSVLLARKQSSQVLLSQSGVKLSPELCKSPTVHQATIRHQQGASMNIEVEEVGYFNAPTVRG